MFRLKQEGMLILIASIFVTLSGVTANAQETPKDYQEVLKSLDRKRRFLAQSIQRREI